MHIDIFHDIACPWCRIGKKNLFDAVEQWGGPPVSVSFRTFFLQPNMPKRGVDFETHMRTIKDVPLETLFDGPRRMGAEAGLTFNFEQIRVAPNTLLAHQLIALTPPDQKFELVDALYTAYFEEGRDIGSLIALLQIAEKTGLDNLSYILAKLEANAMREQVLGEYRQAIQAGITGVPAFVIEGKYLVSGARSVEFWIQSLRKLAAAPV